MKKTTLFLLGFCCTISSFAQTTATKPVKLWDKSFGGNESDILRTMVPLNDGGYLLGGESMSGVSGDKTGSNHGFASHDFWIIKTDANGAKIWDKRFGGADDEVLSVTLPTSDGGYLLGGMSNSKPSGDKTAPARGEYDYWLIKINADGTKLWDKAYGGSKSDFLASIIPTPDGGYLLGGSSQSDISGDKTGSAHKSDFDNNDYWVIKIDDKGTKLWDKRFGGTGSDDLSAIVATKEGGYLLGGGSASPISDDKTAAPIGKYGAYDFWIVKIDTNGNKLWDKVYGGDAPEELAAMVAANDGTYVLGGRSGSGISGSKTEAKRGGEDDYWIVKIDENGTQLWDKDFGGTGKDRLRALIATDDGGFLAGGISDSGAGKDKTDAHKGDEFDDDFWLVRIDKNGTQLWDKTIGGSNFDTLTTLLATKDGGYLIGGYSFSEKSGDKTQPSHNESEDYWVVKMK